MTPQPIWQQGFLMFYLRRTQYTSSSLFVFEIAFDCTSSLSHFCPFALLDMDWRNPVWRRSKNTRSCWGYTFQITPEHLTPEQTHPLKYSYDTLGEEALKKLDALSSSSHYVASRETSPIIKEPSGVQSKSSLGSKDKKSTAVPKKDLYVLLRDNAQTDDVLGKLWSEANTIPSWIDWDQVARGQDVFYRYGGYVVPGFVLLLMGYFLSPKDKS